MILRELRFLGPTDSTPARLEPARRIAEQANGRESPGRARAASRLL